MDKVANSGIKYLNGDSKFNDFGLVFSFSAALFSGFAKGLIFIGFSAKLTYVVKPLRRMLILDCVLGSNCGRRRPETQLH